MNQETWIQIISLIIIVILAIFYNPATTSFQNKTIFITLIFALALFLIIFDIYQKIEKNNIKIKLFNEKWNLNNRIKKLEELNNL
ncbi:MAG: hypothetical protein KJ592_04280 [Nanoarchaeota archaeon]|nr:hypothetical protein [Nanoarchaeota archaeon]